MRFSRPTLLMTRPLEASQRFVAALDPGLIAQCDVIISPLVQIEYLSKDLDLDGIAGVIFTSAHGVNAARNATEQTTLPAYCVGPATTQAAADAGWQAHDVGEDAAGLITTLLAQRPEGSLLHIRGEHARGNIAHTLTTQGLTCNEVVMYTQAAHPFSQDAITAMQADSAIIAPLFSPRTALLFRQGALDRPFQIVAMSSAIADEVQGKRDWTVVTARAPNAYEMRVSVENLLQSHVPG